MSTVAKPIRMRRLGTLNMNRFSAPLGQTLVHSTAQSSWQ